MRLSLPKYKVNFQCLQVSVLLLPFLVIGKDLLHAWIRDYSFYLSDSLLFGSFWFLFIPLFPLSQKRSKGKFRFLIPLALCLLHLLLFSLLVHGLSSIFFPQAFAFERTFLESLARQGLLCLIVYGIGAYQSLAAPTPPLRHPPLPLSRKIKVTDLHKTVLLDCADIIFLKAEKPYIALITPEKKYLYNCSLKKFLAEKGADQFVQIHKSTVVNIHCIRAFTSRKNGDYDLLLSNGESVRASRSFNKNFQVIRDRLGLA